MVGKGISDERTARAKGMRGLGNGGLRREAGIRPVEKRIQRWTVRDMLPAQVTVPTLSQQWNSVSTEAYSENQ